MYSKLIRDYHKGIRLHTLSKHYEIAPSEVLNIVHDDILRRLRKAKVPRSPKLSLQDSMYS